MTKKRIVHIVSLSHSGSTLLGNVLGSHDKMMHIGELYAATKQNDAKVKCMFCLDEQICELWGSELTRPYLGRQLKIFEKYTKDRTSFLRKIINTFNNYDSGDLYEKIIASTLAIRVKPDVLIDSSKNTIWAKYQMISDKFDHKVIFIYRDLRAIWASKIRKFGDSKKGHGTLDILGPWLEGVLTFQKNLETEQFTTINYEDFVLNPHDEIKRLTEFIGLSYNEKMLDYNQVEHHIFGGNGNTSIQNRRERGKEVHYEKLYEVDREYYKTKVHGFVLDERWKSDLSETDLALFRSKLGSLNAQIGYAN